MATIKFTTIIELIVLGKRVPGKWWLKIPAFMLLPEEYITSVQTLLARSNYMVLFN